MDNIADNDDNHCNIACSSKWEIMHEWKYSGEACTKFDLLFSQASVPNSGNKVRSVTTSGTLLTNWISTVTRIWIKYSPSCFSCCVRLLRLWKSNVIYFIYPLAASMFSRGGQPSFRTRFWIHPEPLWLWGEPAAGLSRVPPLAWRIWESENELLILLEVQRGHGLDSDWFHSAPPHTSFLLPFLPHHPSSLLFVTPSSRQAFWTVHHPVFVWIIPQCSHLFPHKWHSAGQLFLHLSNGCIWGLHGLAAPVCCWF